MVAEWRLLLLLPLLAVGTVAEDGYHWAERSRDAARTGTSPHLGPRDIAAGPAWSWPNVHDELMRHSPLIDEKKNIYLLTGNGWVRKFSPDGEMIWLWRTTAQQGKIAAGGVLHDGVLYVASAGIAGLQAGFLFALSLETGTVLWERELPAAMRNLFADSHSLTIHDGVAFLPSRDDKVFPPHSGNNKVVAVRLADGGLLWERLLADPRQPRGHFAVIWNFSPALRGDGTMLFSTPSARAYRLNMSTGEIIWQASFDEPGNYMGCGGGSLSPDGKRFFAVGTHWHTEPHMPDQLGSIPPCGPKVCYFGPGLLLAYNVEDGEILWGRRFSKDVGGQQYPAVGGLDGPGSRTAVFVGVGVNTLFPLLETGPQWVPPIFRHVLSRIQIYSSFVRYLLEVPALQNHLFVLDAETGHEIWTWREEPWDHGACAGDEERFPARLVRSLEDPREEPFCLPDSWAVPTVGGDGTVYAGSGHNGNLYAIRDANGDGRIQAEEVSTFKTHNGFFTSPTLAPGLLVASPCWGPMHVFKS